MSVLFRICLLALLFTLNSCGFQLRGQGPLMPQWRDLAIQVKGDQAQWLKLLEQQLQGKDIELSELKQASYILKLEASGSERRASALGADGYASDYELLEWLSFSLHHADGAVLLLPTRIQALRAYQYTSGDLLAADRERNMLTTELQTELIQQLISRVSSQLRQHASLE